MKYAAGPIKGRQVCVNHQAVEIEYAISLIDDKNAEYTE
jgi:hypothetical protein